MAGKKNDEEPEYTIEPPQLIKTTVERAIFSEPRRDPVLRAVSLSSEKKRSKKNDKDD
jgi:hypothetical protein